MTGILRLAVIVVMAFASSYSRAQVLGVGVVAQEQTQWCWAGCSKCILSYYGKTMSQCDIAEYARQQVTWASFGTVNCCANPDAGCNNPNYEANHAGSIQDILWHFDHIQSVETSGPLTLTQIADQLTNNKLFVEYWDWYTGGGHFVVGYGISGNTIYYMNPWPGEGMSMSTYSSNVDDGIHKWTYTLSITDVLVDVPQLQQPDFELTYPNPSNGMIWLTCSANENTEIKIFSLAGEPVFETILKDNSPVLADLSQLPKGIYIVRSTTSGTGKYSKLVLE